MLKITDLSKTYANGVVALKNVSLEVPKGMFGLLGPNGAGKSTLMRTIATLQEADEGSIYFNDIDVINQKDEVRKRLGYLPQDFGAYPKISPQVMLNHFAVLKGINNKNERKELVQNLLHMTNLYDVRKDAIDKFSGGMKQRFGIAQALLGSPELVIVDEPTAGLDPSERNRFYNLLSEIGENVVIILSTHIVDDVSDLCSNMAIMGNGEILLTGKPREVIDNLKGRLWKKVVARAQLESYQSEYRLIRSHLSAGETVIHVLSDDQPGADFEGVDGDLEDVYFATLAEHGIAVSL